MLGRHAFRCSRYRASDFVEQLRGELRDGVKVSEVQARLGRPESFADGEPSVVVASPDQDRDGGVVLLLVARREATQG